VAFIHRFGSSIIVHRHFHYVYIDGAFDLVPSGGVTFHAAGLDAYAMSWSGHHGKMHFMESASVRARAATWKAGSGGALELCIIVTVS